MEHEFWKDLLFLRKHHAQTLEPVCRRWELTRAEIDVLLFLASDPKADRAVDIVELRGLTKSHVSIAVKQLCERGLLEARQDEADRRVIRLRPTEAAAQIIAEGQESQRKNLEQLFAGFSGEELETYARLQRKVFENIQSLMDR